MKKILLLIVMAFGSMMLSMPAFALTAQEESLLNEVRGGLPVYMGNGLTWSEFDIADNGELVIGMVSNNLPAAEKMTDDLRAEFRKILTDPKSGYVGLSKHMGKNLRLNISNAAKELCISELIVAEEK